MSEKTKGKPSAKCRKENDEHGEFPQASTTCAVIRSTEAHMGLDKKMHCQVNDREYRCHCLHLSEAMVVSMAAVATTSWQQYTNDDEESALNLHCGFSRSLWSFYTETEGDAWKRRGCYI